MVNHTFKGDTQTWILIHSHFVEVKSLDTGCHVAFTLSCWRLRSGNFGLVVPCLLTAEREFLFSSRNVHTLPLIILIMEAVHMYIYAFTTFTSVTKITFKICYYNIGIEYAYALLSNLVCTCFMIERLPLGVEKCFTGLKICPRVKCTFFKCCYTL